MRSTDDGVMRRPRSSFNDIVAEVKAAPKGDVPIKPEPGKVLVGPDGTIFRNIERPLDFDTASQLLEARVWAAIDDCGCAGYCSLEWHSPTEPIRRMPGLRKVKKNQQPFASIEEWRSDDGSVMVLFSGPDFKWD